MIYIYPFSHHQIIVVVFSTVDDANSPPEDPNTFPVESSPNSAYEKVADTMPAAFVAIELLDSEWTDGQFTIGNDTRTSSNPPLRTGFAYRAFMKSYLSNVIYNLIFYIVIHS